MSHQCTICYNDFSWDPSAKEKSQLPVQSRVCSHVLCYSCMIAIYEAGGGDVIQLACPECRLKGAHDPFVPIVSLPLCDLLAERHSMVKRDPSLEEIGERVRQERRASKEQQQQQQSISSATQLLASAAVEKAESVGRVVQEQATVWRLTKEVSRAVYWSSILLFGAIDRNETAIVEQESVEKIWNKATETMQEQLENAKEKLHEQLEL